MKRIAALVGISLLSSGFSYAQDVNAPTPVKKKNSNRLLEEVTVTAQKREENSQDVPISISAFSSEKLDAFGIESTADLARITPGLTFTFTYGYTLIYLRGVGTDAFLPSADPSVATYIDGINIPSSQGKNDTLGPVERVEVLKGPQGTLFGRNSTGGAINIVTANPPEEFVGSLNAEYGVYDLDSLNETVDKKSYSVYVGSPLTEDIGFTLAYFEELPMIMGKNTTNEGVPAPERKDFTKGGRLKLRWDISDTLSATLIGSYIHQFNGNSLVNENTRPSALVAGSYEPDKADRNWHNDIQGGNETENTMYAAVFEWSPGPIDMKFIYADNAIEIPFAAYDYDSTENSQVTFFTFDGQFNEQQTYELQFTSNAETPGSDKFEWVAGLYRLEAEGGFDSLFFTVGGGGFAENILPIDSLVTAVPALNGVLSNPALNVTLEAGSVLYTTSNSAFFQGTYTFNEAWNLTLGARYQSETRGIRDAFLDAVLGTSGKQDDPYYRSRSRENNQRISTFSVPDVKEETMSPRIAVQYLPTDSTQIYASASQGFKSPTYNTINFFSDPDLVGKETATAVELGIKTDLFDDTLRLNAAIFKTDIKDVLTAIVSLTSGGIVRFQNAGRSEIEGAEMDFQWQPMSNINPGLALTGSVTYLDAKYTEYTNGAGFDDDTGLYFGPDGLTGNTERDFSGNDVVRTPDISYTFAANQRIAMGNAGDLEIGVDYYYNGGYNTTPQNSPFFEQEAYGLWNARLSYFYDPYGLQLTAFVNNALDEEYFGTILQQDFGRTVVLAPPRLMGMRVKWNFDQMFY
jgi:iron complex outermembrane receptor protein